MGKGKGADAKREILAFFEKHRGASIGVDEIARQVRLTPQQVLTLLGQLKDKIECVSKATIESKSSMKWVDVDSKWKLKGAAPARKKVPMLSRPGTTPQAMLAAAELRARVQGGTLPYENLRLAGYLGHSPALEALGDKASSSPVELEPWLAGLPSALRVRAIAALVRAALGADPDVRLGRVLGAVDAWLASPTRDTAARCAGTALAAETMAEETKLPVARATFRLGILAAAIEAGRDEAHVRGLVRDALSSAVEALPGLDVRSKIREELVAHVLAR